MALRKRAPSLKLRKAAQRHVSMQNIDASHGKTVNYGGDDNPLTSRELGVQINLCSEIVNKYNQLLEQADALAEKIINEEETLGELYTRVLAGAKSIFGVNSDEVEILGGTKRTMRKKSGKNRTGKQTDNNY